MGALVGYSDPDGVRKVSVDLVVVGGRTCVCVCFLGPRGPVRGRVPFLLFQYFFNDSIEEIQ